MLLTIAISSSSDFKKTGIFLMQKFFFYHQAQNGFFTLCKTTENFY